MGREPLTLVIENTFPVAILRELELFSSSERDTCAPRARLSRTGGNLSGVNSLSVGTCVSAEQWLAVARGRCSAQRDSFPVGSPDGLHVKELYAPDSLSLLSAHRNLFFSRWPTRGV